MIDYLTVAECAKLWGISSRGLANRLRRARPEIREMFRGSPRRISREDLPRAEQLLGLVAHSQMQGAIDQLTDRVETLEATVLSLLSQL